MTDTFTITDRYGDPVQVAHFGSVDAVFLRVVEAGEHCNAALSDPTTIRSLADELNAAADRIEANRKREGL